MYAPDLSAARASESTVHAARARPMPTLAEVAADWPTRTLEEGETLWFGGDEADELAFVEAGSLSVIIDRHPIGQIPAGQIVGEASAFMPVAARTATVRADGPTTVRVCSRARLDALRSDRDVAYDVLLDTALEALAFRVKGATARLARLAESMEPRPDAQPCAERTAPPSEMERTLSLHAARLALRTLPVLDRASDTDISTLAGYLSSRIVKAGETICVQGASDSTVFLVGDGRFDVVVNVGSHGAVTAAELDRGAMVGLLGLLLDTPRSATVIARTDCWVLEMSAERHAGLHGDLGRMWREMLLRALRDHIDSANGSLRKLEARRANLLDRRFDREDTFASLGNGLAWPIREPSRLAAVSAQATAILHALAPHRRLLPHSGECAITPCADCYGMHRPRVERAVAAGAPIHFILPAFPAKSPNSDTKVLGKDPDMAEEVALRYLQRVCDDIRAVYTPGARVTLCSDGRVFSDLVLVTDDEVTAYGLAIEEMIARIGLRDIDTFNLEDLFEVTTFDGMRDHLTVHYCDAIEALRARSKTDRGVRSMVDGIHRFLFEDTLAVQKDKSRNKIRKECRTRAYDVILRSNAFSRLIAECFPGSLRLSIHPQAPHSAKIGILLGHAEGCWITPWHGVAMLTEEGYTLVKRSQAEEMGARLVERHGRPSHFVLGDVAEPDLDAKPAAPGAEDWKSLYDMWFATIENSQDYIDGRLPIWFFGSAEADERLRREFAPWLTSMTPEIAEEWKKTTRGFLALILLYDQVPRNAFRNTPAMFAYDRVGRDLARQFLAKGLQSKLDPIEAFWLYLPFQHHPAMNAQDISVEGVHGAADRCQSGHERFFDIARDMADRHRIAIRRFGRFPHRNDILGRASTPQEELFLEDRRNHF